MNAKEIEHLCKRKEQELLKKYFGLHHAYEDATRRTLWERITKTNHNDVTSYKGLLEEYARDLLLCMRCDFIEDVNSGK